MKNLIACCGLNCEECEARIATVNDDDALREVVVKKCREEYECPIHKCAQSKNFATFDIYV